MKKIVHFSLIVATVFFASSCKNDTQTSAASAIKAAVASPEKEVVNVQKEKVERGGYLVATIGCSDCHSPKKMTANGPVPDEDRFLSGYNAAEPLSTYDPKLVKDGRWLLFNGQLTAFAGPWGVSFAANLTPDETGIGNWSLAQFKKAIREGKSKGLDGNRMLLPPMPWPNFAKLTDADIEAVFLYLKTIKPVKNVVPAPIPPKV